MSPRLPSARTSPPYSCSVQKEAEKRLEKDCEIRMYYPTNCDKKNVHRFMKMLKEKMES